MKCSPILCFALGFAIALIYLSQIAIAGESVTNTVSSIEAQPSLETLLQRNFPGEKLKDMWSPEGAKRIQQLAPAERNRIALAAAREVTLRTTNGYLITAQTMDKDLFQGTALDTPAQAEVRALAGRNLARIELLHDMENMENLYLISDAGVIEPLINILDFPGKQSFPNDIALDTLRILTGRDVGDYSQWNDHGPKHQQLVTWWRDWWSANKSKHPVFDSDLVEMVRKRIATIELQIAHDGTNYYELGRLKPESILVERQSRYKDELFDEVIDTSMLQEGILRVTPDGKRKPIEEADWVYLHITARFGTPRPDPRTNTTKATFAFRGSSHQPVKQEMLHEILPGTDVVIAVETASDDKLFLELIRDSLSRIPPNQ